jgi:hypothetical protein
MIHQGALIGMGQMRAGHEEPRASGKEDRRLEDAEDFDQRRMLAEVAARQAATRGKKWLRREPSKAAAEHAAVLELFVRAAGTGVVAAEFFDQFLEAADDADAAFDLRFGWEPFTALAGALEKRGRRVVRCGLPYSLPS